LEKSAEAVVGPELKALYGRQIFLPGAGRATIVLNARTCPKKSGAFRDNALNRNYPPRCQIQPGKKDQPF